MNWYLIFATIMIAPVLGLLALMMWQSAGGKALFGGLAVMAYVLLFCWLLTKGIEAL